MKKETIMNMSQKAKAAIGILSCLLLLSSAALIGQISYLNELAQKPATTVVTENLISEETAYTNPDTPESTGVSADAQTPTAGAVQEEAVKAPVIALYKGKASNNEKFEIKNMLPGDIQVKYFAVKVTHQRDVEVRFSLEITGQTKNLADVLNIKVTHLEGSKVLYDGSLAQMDASGYGQILKTESSTETLAHYKIEVSLPGSTGNEYQASMLLADFNWFVTDADVLDAPQTGDTSELKLTLAVMLCSFSMIVILLILHPGKKEDKNAQ